MNYQGVSKKKLRPGTGQFSGNGLRKKSKISNESVGSITSMSVECDDVTEEILRVSLTWKICMLG